MELKNRYIRNVTQLARGICVAGSIPVVPICGTRLMHRDVPHELRESVISENWLIKTGASSQTANVFRARK